MDTILTLTLNAAIDLGTSVDLVIPERKLRCALPRRDPGGGGINVARVAHRLGVDVCALYLAGGFTGDRVQRMLEEEGVPQRRIPIGGTTRENVIVWENSSGQLYRFGMPGPQVTREEWVRCLLEVESYEPAPTYLVASGSVPPGVPADFYARLAEIARDRNARLIVDTSGEALAEALRVGVFLVKPNMREFEELAGRQLADEYAQKAAACKLIDDGAAEVVVVSLGAAGALLAVASDAHYVRSPIVRQRSRVGAGDSMVGGIVTGLVRGMAIEDAVRYGVAAGAAAVMTDGTELCHPHDVEHLYEEISGPERT
ncbi:MAG TPA: 1-phosphofructokinase family hexose kinase [Longimicrobiales bacterium]|nr:1-phosphofructokinase family hexose kinase [Longimicrobiales bacterium]